MYIVAVEGGLGNQMFQYAFYLALQKHYEQVEMKVDLSLINPNIHNGYELQRLFHVNPDTCSKKETLLYSDYCPYSITGSVLFNLLFGIRRKLLGRKESFILQRDATEYIAKCFELDANRNYYFKGVWINTDYFKGIETDIKSSFVFPEIHDETNMKWKEMIENSNSVSIHFRGGDYYKNGFSVLDQGYYKRAIDILKQKADDLTFFIFTDDIEHAKCNIGDIENSYYVSNNQGEESYIDMQLMTLCKHNIMANSTFSFWGAYLNAHEDKIVIGSKAPIDQCKEPYYFEGVELI